MKEIKLTQGYSSMVDDDLFDYLNQWKWQVVKDSHTNYAVRNEGKFPFRKRIKMHREIMKPSPNMQVDHVDGNGLNNVRENLRVCTQSQNKKNARKRKDSTSGFKGVTYYKRYGNWRSQIAVNGKRINLGYFSDPIDAAHAYDNAAREYHGEFANTNF